LASSKPSACLADVDAIVKHLGKNAQGGDVVCVFRNGGFGGIRGKLLERLKFRKEVVNAGRDEFDLVRDQSLVCTPA